MEDIHGSGKPHLYEIPCKMHDKSSMVQALNPVWGEKPASLLGTGKPYSWSAATLLQTQEQGFVISHPKAPQMPSPWHA